MIINNQYIKELTVPPSAIDELQHVNNTVYLQWMQDVATEHWNEAASSEQKDSLLWVVARHEIDYKRQAFEGDELVVTTWIGEMTPKISKRYTQISRKKDNKVLTQAVTHWSPIDMQTKRPTRVNPDDYIYLVFKV